MKVSKSLLEELKDLLKKDERLVSKDKLLKNRIVELALKLDKDLLKLLLSDKRIKEHFFTEIDKTIVFDKEKFMKFIDNKEFLPDSYTAFKNKIGLSADRRYIAESKEIVLSWPYKDCILEGGQEKEDEKRDEMFHNEILAPDEIDRLLGPKVFTNLKRIDAKGEHEVTEIKSTNNFIIKGNNLLVLHSLKKRFAGKIKLIYIDPPYNTGSDSFGYNDNFNHSTWLTFMKNRLEIAKELLSNEGVICIQCDDFEQSYLKILCDEVFGREHFQSAIYIQVRYSSKQLAKAMTFHKLIETIFVYSKTDKPKIYQEEEEYDTSRYIWEIKEGKPFKQITLGGLKVEVFDKNKFTIIKHEKLNNKLLKEIWASGKILDSSSTGRFFRDHLTGRYKEDGYGVLYKVHGMGEGISGCRYITGPIKEGATRGKYYQEIPRSKLNSREKEKIVIPNFYDMAANFGNCRHEGGVPFRSGKKPEILIKKIISFTTREGDLVLDFFLGSGTTAAVAHKMKRQFIGIEQLHYKESDSVVRLKNVINGDKTGISKAVNWEGGGDFVYCELKELNEEFVQKIKKAKDVKELLKIWEEMKEHAFLSYKIDPKDVDESIKEFKDLSMENKKKFLIECLDKNDLYVNYSEMEDKQYKVSKEDIELNRRFYGGL